MSGKPLDVAAKAAKNMKKKTKKDIQKVVYKVSNFSG